MMRLLEPHIIAGALFAILAIPGLLHEILLTFNEAWGERSGLFYEASFVVGIAALFYRLERQSGG